MQCVKAGRVIVVLLVAVAMATVVAVVAPGVAGGWVVVGSGHG